MIKNMLGKMTTTTTNNNNNNTGGEREATPPRDVPKKDDDSLGASSAQQLPNHHHQSSPKTFAEKFAMSLDDISFVDGEDAYGDGPFMRDAMMVASKRNSLDNSNVDARKAKRDEELTIYGFQKDTTAKGRTSARSSVRSSFDDFFYGSRVPKAEKNAENNTNTANINRTAASVDYPHPQWEHKVIRELHRKELARDHPEAKFRSEK